MTITDADRLAQMEELDHYDRATRSMYIAEDLARSNAEEMRERRHRPSSLHNVPVSHQIF